MVKRIENWSLRRIAGEIGGSVRANEAPKSRVTGVSIDTRTIGTGEVFFALRGERFDGHDFAKQAFDKRASGIVARPDRLPDEVMSRGPVIAVEDPLEALQTLGNAVWREAVEQTSLVTVNVTGSNGKTTVKEFLRVLFGIDGSVFATEGNLNNHIGVPLTLCRMPAECSGLVLEMGANAVGDISELIRLAPGDIRLITSIGRAHLKGFGDLDGVRRVKSEIFEEADNATTAVVPADDVDKLHLNGIDNVRTFGFERQADYRVRNYRTTEAGAVFDLNLGRDGRRLTDLELPLPGSHHAANLACALAAMGATKTVPKSEQINRAIGRVRLPGGRWRVTRKERAIFIDDAYNANPDSVRASARAFGEYEIPPEFSRVVVLGQMDELGDEAKRLHAKTAKSVAKMLQLDGFVAVGPYNDTMGRAVSEAVPSAKVLATDSYGEVIDWLASMEPVAVLLKASRVAQLEDVVQMYSQKSPRG